MNKKFKVAVVVLVVIIVGWAVFGPDNGNPEQRELKFGLITVLSGDYAVVGEQSLRGALLAQEEWNDLHPERQIEIIPEDDVFDSKKGVLAYKKLTEVDKVDGLINITTVTMDAIYSDVVKTNLPVAMGFEQGIEATDDNVFQLWPGTVPAEIELGKHIKDSGFEKVVVFIDNGSPVFTRFAEGFKEGYGSSLTEIKVSSGVTDIKSSALKAHEVRPDAVVFIIRPSQGALLIKELEVLSDGRYQYVFDANIQTGFSEYVGILGDANVLNGSILYTVPNIHRQEFTEKFVARYNEEPLAGSETGYNSFMLLALTYDSDREKWVRNMSKVKFEGADGEIVFDERGVRIPRLEIGTIEGGKLPE